MEGNGGGGGSSSNHGATGFMGGFKDNNGNGLSSMLMMMPLMAPPPQTQPNSEMINTMFLPLSSNNNNNNNQNHHNNINFGFSNQMIDENDNKNTGCYFMMKNNEYHRNNNNENNNNNNSSSSSSCSFRAKIMAHPHYLRLLIAYINCQKVGAPPEVVKRLEEVIASEEVRSGICTGCIGEDPGLDQFMEAYCEMLTKYEQELTKPFKEAMLFITCIESQLKTLTVASPDSGHNNGSSEEDFDANENYIDPQADDKELKLQLLRKYGGYLGSLKQEFLKKRKKGKLPKEARQELMDWWTRHYKWPYPSETQKVALAESTGLDQKQINNWFINQRKRHWKPSEEMQFVVMDATHVHPSHQYYIDNLLTTNPFTLDNYSCPPSSFH